MHSDRSACRRAVMVSAIARPVICLAAAVPAMQAEFTTSKDFVYRCLVLPLNPPPRSEGGPLPHIPSLKLILMPTPAGLERQPLAAARQAASGILAGLAAAAVALSAGPAGAEVRMPPIDRNGERLHRARVPSRITTEGSRVGLLSELPAYHDPLKAAS